MYFCSTRCAHAGARGVLPGPEICQPPRRNVALKWAPAAVVGGYPYSVTSPARPALAGFFALRLPDFLEIHPQRAPVPPRPRM